MCAFNYRFVPAIRLAREMLEAGELGEIYHFRAATCRSGSSTRSSNACGAGEGRRRIGRAGRPGRPRDRSRALSRRRDQRRVGLARTFVPERPGGRVDVDDAVEAVVDFESGALGTIEASRFCQGRKNALSFEINGRRDRSRSSWSASTSCRCTSWAPIPARTPRGSGSPVTEAYHPFWEWWWPHGHVIGWEHTFVHEIHHLLAAIAATVRCAPTAPISRTATERRRYAMRSCAQAKGGP